MQDSSSSAPHVIQHGSKEFLVEHLISADPTFMADFMWSFRYFMRPADLLQSLMQRYLSLRGTGDAESMAVARGKQLRVVNVLRKWVEQHFCDFAKDDPLLCQLYEFVVEEVAKDREISKYVTTIVTCIQQKTALLLDEEAEQKRLHQLSELMRDHDGGVKPSARSVAAKSGIPKTISSADIVLWLFDHEMVSSRDEAQKLCLQLFELGLLVHPQSSNTSPSGSSISSTSSIGSILTNVAALSSAASSSSPSSTANASSQQPPAVTAEAFADDSAQWILSPPPPLRYRIIDPSTNIDSPFVLQIPLSVLTQQLTLVEHRLFCEIVPQYDLQSQSWNKPTDPENPSAVLKLVQRTDKVALWVATEVLHSASMKTRRDALRRWIEVAIACKQINNLGTTVGILAGIDYLRNAKTLWRGIPSKTTNQLEELHTIFKADQNYAQYRAAVKKVRGTPCMPYIGIFLRDLTFLEESSVLTPQPNVINFNKCRQLAAVFSDIGRLQECKYDFAIDFSLREYLTEGFSYAEEDEVMRLATSLSQEAPLA